MNLQGRMGCKYHVGMYFSEKCTKKKLVDSWPKSPEENMERLRDAGIPVDRMIPKCSNCDGGLFTRYSC